MQSTDYLFVYGTLHPGSAHPLARRLAQRSRMIGPATVAGRLYRIGTYPGLVPDPSAGPVHGVVLRLKQPDRLLPLLDAYEECSDRFPTPHEYVRRPIRVDVATGPLDAWAYLYNWPVDEATRIADGRFVP